MRGELCRESSDSEQAVSADDLLSTTIAAVIVAKPERLVSCLEYLKLFHSTGDWSGKTGFQVATLEAAAAYIEQLNRAFSTFSASGKPGLCTLLFTCQERLSYLYTALRSIRPVPPSLVRLI